MVCVGGKMDKRYQVFISSTFADLEDERKGVMEAIIELDCFPAGMEMFPASNMEQFEYIKSVIDESDYYVIIVAGRYGSIADDGISYTEKEFDYAKEKGIPILAFVKKDITNLPGSKLELDPENRKRLDVFREKVLNGRMAKFWETKDELKYNLHSSLSQEMKVNPKTGWIRGNTAADADLYEKIESLRNERDNYKERYENLLKDQIKLNDQTDQQNKMEVEDKLKKKFYIAFKSNLGAEHLRETSIKEILQHCAIFMLSDINAEILSSVLEDMMNGSGITYSLAKDSLSLILLKLLALNIIEDTKNILKDNLILTDIGRKIILSLVAF